MRSIPPQRFSEHDPIVAGLGPIHFAYLFPDSTSTQPMNRQELSQTLTEFGKTCGLPELAFDDAGYCCLSFDDVTVNLETDANGERLLLYAGLGQIGPDTEPDLLASLLDANFFLRGTGGGTLGVDRATGSVALVQTFSSSEITANRLEAAAKNFVDLAESWMIRLAEAGHGGVSAGDDAVAAPTTGFEPQPWTFGGRV